MIIKNKYFRLFRVAIIPRSSLRVPANPIKLVEALASGKPVIATKVPGIADMVNEEDGIVFAEPDNEDSLASAILRLLDNEHMIFTLSRKALRASQKFDLEQQLNKLLKALS